MRNRIKGENESKCKGRNSPGGPVVKSPPSKVGDMILIPSRASKIPHAPGQLSLWVAREARTS